jgi:hypothetical protein
MFETTNQIPSGNQTWQVKIHHFYSPSLDVPILETSLSRGFSSRLIPGGHFNEYSIWLLVEPPL